LAPQRTALLGIMLALIALNIPILLSYNVQERFFLPMMPLFAVLAGLFAHDLVAFTQRRGFQGISYTIIGIISLLILFSFLRVVSVSILLTHDSRIMASEFVQKLPLGSTIEYTLYPPAIPRENFSGKTNNYPLIFIKFADQEVPAGNEFKFNTGERGIEQRQPDYLIVDSFTVNRFDDTHICELHREDCVFFSRLRDAQTNYRLIAAFEYDLPAILPNPKASFVNPDIYIYQRHND
jgi:hypothetical protein